jgi:hypothetical protein
VLFHDRRICEMMSLRILLGGLAMRTGLLAVLVLIPCLAGCASSMSGPSASLQAAPDEAVTAQRGARTAMVKKRAPAKAVARASAAEPPYDAPAQAEVPTGTIGLSPVDAARANAATAIEAGRLEDERLRRIMTICANCGMTPGDR